MDIKIPDWNRYDITRQICHFNKSAVKTQTGCIFTCDKDFVQKAGYNEYISKPIYVNILLQLL